MTLSITTLPYYPQLRETGWYSEAPTVMYSSSITTGEPIWWSLGNVTSATAYIAETSGTAAYLQAVLLEATALSGVADIEGVAVYYNTSGGITTGSPSVVVQYATEEPSISGISFVDVQGNTVDPTSGWSGGYIRVGDFRGHTTDYTSGSAKVRPLVEELYINVGGVPIATITPPSGVTTGFAGTSGTVVYPNGKYDSQEVIWFSSGSTVSTDPVSDYSSFDIYIDPRSFTPVTKEVGIGVGIGTSVRREWNDHPAGISYTTGTPYVLTDVPSVDRLSVRADEASSAIIVGNVIHTTGRLNSVQYTTERRVPNLHVPFAGGYLNTSDYKAPTMLSPAGVYGVAAGGPYDSATNPGCLKVHQYGGHSMITYPGSHISLFDGTIDIYSQIEWTGSLAEADRERTYVIWDFAIKDSAGVPMSTHSRMVCFYYFSAGTWKVCFRVVDNHATTHNAIYNLGYTSGTESSLQTWRHLRCEYRLNSANDCYLNLYVDGTIAGTVVTSGTIPFGLTMSDDLWSRSAAAAASTATRQYTDLHIGRDVWGTAQDVGSTTIRQHLADLRVLDITGDDTHPWEAEEFSGWSTDGSSLYSISSNYTNTFKISRPTQTADEVEVIKIRPVGASFECAPASFFNTGVYVPAVLRGNYSGVDLGDETVYRFRLIDAQGQFSDLQFTINPTGYDYSPSEEMFEVSSSINGRVLAQIKNPGAEKRSFNWDNITRAFMVKLKRRAESGNTFILLDHNDEVLYGKFSITGINEIVATVPSRYRVQGEFIGTGGRFDYSMGMQREFD